MSDPAPTPTVQLGCGTLILIALIVAIFSQGGHRNELRSIQNRLDRIEKLLSKDGSLDRHPQDPGHPIKTNSPNPTPDPPDTQPNPPPDNNPPSASGNDPQ